jgi:molybdate transport system ATP-binding protein
VVFQEHRLFPHYSVKGNLLYGADGHGREEFSRIVALLELAPLLDRRINDLSGGERQRIALGRALLSRPRLLLLDEPLASLDLRLRRQIIPHLRRVRDELNVPIVYVSHDLTEILQLTDQLLIIERGRSVACGRYGDIVHTDAVLAVVHDRGMNNVLSARVLEHHAEDGVTLLEVGPGQQEGAAGRLFAPLCPAVVGAAVSISIRPWDIALAAAPVSGVSILNQVRGTVMRCSAHERRMLVDVDIGAPLIVEISRRSAAALHIEPGTPILCLVKSHSVQYLGDRV